MESIKIIAAIVIVVIVLGLVAESLSAVLRVVLHNWYWILGAVVLYFLLKDKR